LIATVPTFDPSVGDLAMALGAGSTVCVAPWLEVAVDLAQCIRKFGATHVCTTPAMWAAISANPSAVPSLRRVVLGGDFTPPSLIDKWAAAVDLYNAYGVTEATVYGARFRRKFPLEDAIGSHAFAPLEALACVGPMSFRAGVHSSCRLTL
jgi:non-ribosomal peptide synthetase component F